MAPLDPKVGAVFDACAPAVRAALLDLRSLIFETARANGVGEIIETLKWGQPSYLPAKPRIGTTLRIDAVKGSGDRYAVYVNCKTTLLDSYRLLYPDTFEFEGQRAILMSTRGAPPTEALRHCIALALTYHRAKAG